MKLNTKPKQKVSNPTQNTEIGSAYGGLRVFFTPADPPIAVMCSGERLYTAALARTHRTAALASRTLRYCYSADIPSPVLLKHVLKEEGGCS